MPRVHETALVSRDAVLGEGCEVAAYAIVDAGAILGAGTRVLEHAIVRGGVTAGVANVFHPFSVVGGEPQARRHDGALARVILGDRNVVREHVTIHGGTEGRATTLGSDNLFMAGVHVAHDCVVGSHTTLANAVQLAGHAVVEDHATFGGLSGVAQFVRVGESAFVAAGAMCERNVPPFVIVQGDRARVRAINVVGLRRRGIPEASIDALTRAFRVLHSRKAPLRAALRAIDRSDPRVDQLCEALSRT
jgi:UDP-N-acetylglucosamine acyltransferase